MADLVSQYNLDLGDNQNQQSTHSADLVSQYGLSLPPVSSEELQNSNTPTTYKQPAFEATPTSDPLNVGLGKDISQGLKAIPSAIWGEAQGVKQFGEGVGESALRGLNYVGAVPDKTLADYSAWYKTQQAADEAANPQGGIGRTTGGILGAVGSFPVGGAAKGFGGAAIDAGKMALAGFMQPADSLKGQTTNAAMSTGLSSIGNVFSSLLGSVKGVIENKKALEVVANEGKLQEMAQTMVDQGKPASDINEALYNHLQNVSDTVSTTKDALYNNFAQQAQQVGKQIPLTNFGGQLNQIEAGLNKTTFLSDDSKNLLNTVQKYKQQMYAGNGTLDPMALVGQNGIRNQISQDASQLGTSNAGILNQLKPALAKDVMSFAKMQDAPGLVDSLNQANDYYANVYTPFKQNKLVAPLLNANMTVDPQTKGQLFQKFVNINNPDAVKALQATPELNQNLAGQVISDAFDNSFTKGKTSYGEFNPNQFINNIYKKGLNQLPQTYQNLFTPELKEQLTGFANLLKTSENGKNNVLWTAVSSPIQNVVHKLGGEPLAKLTEQAGPKILLSALNTPVVGSLLTKAANMQPNSALAKRTMLGVINAVGQYQKNQNTDIPDSALDSLRFPNQTINTKPSDEDEGEGEK